MSTQTIQHYQREETTNTTSSLVERQDVSSSLERLSGWIERNGLQGYDPYDALASPLIFWIGNRSGLAGRITIQILRYLPFNLRPKLGISPEWDAKALGLVARAHFLLWDLTGATTHWRCATECIEILESIAVRDFAGTCWAHPFPYYSSRSRLPPNFPTVVSTVYAAHAFLDGYERSGKRYWLDVTRSACDFILTDLSRIGNDDRFCFSYYPGVRLPVHNANLLAAALLARVARLMGEDDLMKAVLASLRYTLADQQPSGSWPYDGPESSSRNNTFVDGFHTGFVLESLLDISQNVGMDLDKPIARGLQFYLDHLFDSSGHPRRQINRLWPLDLRDCAQAIIVLSLLRGDNLSANGMLHQVVGWTIRNMQASGGYFYYLRWKWFVTPIPYIRFQGWMMVALAQYLHALARMAPA